MKTFADSWIDIKEASKQNDQKPREPRIRFFKPSELRNFEPQTDIVLIGDCHIMRGEVFVIGGEPGVGKSTSATELSFCGATGRDWLGLPVHCPFKTMIVQTENGRYRLRQEYQARGALAEIEDAIRVSEPPPYGLTLGHPDFQTDIKAALEEFRPDVVIFDPWNAAAKDDKQKDYSEAFDALRNILPTGKDRPALGVVAHTRKPKADEKRTGGSQLMHLLAGSYVLSSVPRSIFIMVRGSAEETDDSVVWFNPKNSNGPCAGRSAWTRGPAGFSALLTFDWKEFDEVSNRKLITLEHIEEALGSDKWRRADAVSRLEVVTGFCRRACQKALLPDGKFGGELTFDGESVSLA